MPNLCEKIKQFFQELSIKDACKSTCCIKTEIIIEEHNKSHHHHKHGTKRKSIETGEIKLQLESVEVVG